MQDLHYYLGFNLVNGIGPARLDRLIAYFGSLEDAWNGHTGDLALAGLDGRSIAALLEVRRTRDLEAEYDRVVASGRSSDLSRRSCLSRFTAWITGCAH